MKLELDNILCERYPYIMVNRYQTMNVTCMCWGFECGDGWFTILDQLMSKIQHHIDWKNKKDIEVPQVTFDQVKEKFGSLRIYYSGGDDVIDGMIQMAQSMSSVTCEQCGNPGSMRGRGWLYTSCNTHAKPLDQESEVKETK